MQRTFMARAIELSVENVKSGTGGPFGCVIVLNGKIIAEGVNRVTATNDPTAHAEIVAIREACQKLDAFQLEHCEIYTSCEPCPMCLGAIYWARPAKLYFASTAEDAARAGFDDRFIYEQLEVDYRNRTIPAIQLMREEAKEVFRLWQQSSNRVDY
jgi:tRNA(Arg) A34 adenosine deaminase TadA